MSKNITGKVFHSFDELAEAYGFKPYTKRTNDENKLNAQREKLLGKCPVCHEPMKYISGTNILVCSNEKCNGFKHTKTGADGSEITYYEPVTRILSETGGEIARTLFD